MSTARRLAKVRLITALLENPKIVDIDQGHYGETDGTPGEVWTELEAAGVIQDGELSPTFSALLEAAVSAAVWSNLENWGQL